MMKKCVRVHGAPIYWIHPCEVLASPLSVLADICFTMCMMAAANAMGYHFSVY